MAKTGMGKIVGKLLKMGKEQLGDLKEKAKVEAKRKANELIQEIKDRLPTKEEIKDRIIEEIKTRGKPIACSIKSQNLTEKAYNKFKKISDTVNTKSAGMQLAILSIITKSDFGTCLRHFINPPFRSFTLQASQYS